MEEAIPPFLVLLMARQPQITEITPQDSFIISVDGDDVKGMVVSAGLKPFCFAIDAEEMNLSTLGKICCLWKHYIDGWVFVVQLPWLRGMMG